MPVESQSQSQTRTLITVPSTTVEETGSPDGWAAYLDQWGYEGFHQLPQWLRVFESALKHKPFYLQAIADGKLTGVLPLALVESRLFGRFLVSLPYLNSSGVMADDNAAAESLIDYAVDLADRLNVRSLELRHEWAIEHPALNVRQTEKVHMRLPLPESSTELWDGLKSKVRNQIRKAESNERLHVDWGREDLLADFYSVFARNMRDLGTPVYSRSLFLEILRGFPDQAEFCRVCLDETPIAGALLIHGPGVTQVPSASSLKEYNKTNVNMLMYWRLLERAVERIQQTFDFGRSTRGGNTFRFKKQWGAQPHPAVWQSYVRQGDAREMRSDSRRFQMAVHVWKRLPVWITRVIGPMIVRGIP